MDPPRTNEPGRDGASGVELRAPEATYRVRVGIDLVRVSRVEESLARFGSRFMRRLFTKERSPTRRPLPPSPPRGSLPAWLRKRRP